MNLLIGYLAGAAFGYLGYRARALTIDGAIAACLVGGTIFGFGGLGCAILLIVFFVSSSALSFVGGKDTRKQTAAETFDKGGRRDAWQVLANGGVAAVAALILGIGANGSGFDPAQEQQLRVIILSFGAFIGSLAAATADTWATEIGTLSKNDPRLVTTGRKVQAGTSGGVTVLGSSAALIGASLIGLAAIPVVLLTNRPSLSTVQVGAILLAAVAGGLGGMLVDSLLGATLQAQYYCPACKKPTESRVHRCGTPTTLVSGVAWINNDVVNFVGTLAGGIVGLLVALIMPFIALSMF